MKLFEVLLKILILLVMPTPKNIKDLLGMFNGMVAESDGEKTHKFSQNQWDEIRRLRDAKAKKSDGKIR